MPRAKNKKQKQCLAPAGAADSELPPPAPILDLPVSILRHILAQLPLKFRLSTCSLVCSAWAAAAADATTAVVIESTYRWEQRHYDSLAAWLRKHASSATLQQLVVSGKGHKSFYPKPEPCIFPLPWQQLLGLRVLKLPGRKVLPAGSMLELSRLTALTELDLRGVLCSNSSRGTNSSSQIVTRRQAKAQQQQAEQPPPQPDAASVAATVSDLARTLPRLPALESLALGGDNARAILPSLTAAVAPAAGDVNVLQQQLASLRLSRATCITPELIAALPATLTRLELQAWLPTGYGGSIAILDSFKVSPASTPRLGQLTQLQQLDLRGIGLDCSEPGSLTGLFSALAQLTAFSIKGSAAVVSGDATHKPELAEFLSAVGGMTGLRSLEIVDAFCCVNSEDGEDQESEGPGSEDSESGGSEDEGSEDEGSEDGGSDDEGSEDGGSEDEGSESGGSEDGGSDEELWSDEEEGEEPPADSVLLSAALVSPSLTRLCLYDVSLPRGCGPHMFGRPGLRLPHLAVLDLAGPSFYEPGPFNTGFSDRYLTAADVRSFFSCVEGGCLRELRLEGVIKDRGVVDWGELSALTTLTNLCVDTSTKGVEQLTSLVELHLWRAEAPDETLAAIAQHLTRLTSFSASDVSVSERAARAYNVTTVDDDDQDVGVGFDYELMSAAECKKWGLDEERYSLPVCERLARDLRAVGIMLPGRLPMAARRKRKAAGG